MAFEDKISEKSMVVGEDIIDKARQVYERNKKHIPS